MLKIQIKTKLPENCALSTLKEISKEVTLKIEGLTISKNRIKGLVNLKATKVGEILENLPSFCDGLAVSQKEAKVLIREHTCLVAYPILESGCIITDVDFDKQNIFWDIICDDDSFITLIRNLEDYDVDFEITYKGKPESDEKITYREEEVLRIALQKGYFDYPKKIKLEELASYFGIAPSTLSEILRRAQKKVLERYFKA
ncbi:HTH DNA binding domain protein [Archaeoglobus sulfaticallidus PM70-1]|uniref:HTH DNA binding domain protein n=1 Tax=Archaeoglobus sulfaticallidus PM70-1 TaxID=387631 RepID=N0BK61_9EURY|nr:helix-turn-helix domain-containing protein [Archaeoglobus sulfaticallidus]AGK60505.1 HTH DNA binding domain protein [Archaeoglobus sulfaticallidus PM70-1]